MNTRLRQNVWLIEKCTPASDEDGSYAFKGASPPTYEVVYLNFRAQHDHLQAITNRNSKTYDAAKKTALEVIEWWKKTGILSKQTSSIIEMITKLYKQWQKLYSCRKLNTDFKQKERKNFLEKLKETFWVPCPKYEASLQQSTDPRLQEDHQFLEKLRKGEKVVTGKLDVKLLKRNKRKASGEERLLNQSTEEDGDQKSLLNKRSNLISKCRHRNKFKLKNLK